MMVKPLDITGERYGRLVAIKRIESKNRRTQWRFRCDCGSVADIGLEAVRAGATRSCGCLLRETTRNRSLKHGHSVGYTHSPEWCAWLSAKQRCFNPNDHKYSDYGARGITMHPAWTNDFAAFFAEVGPKPSARHSLDRIDVNGDYAPGNVRWATPKEQSRNRRSNVYVTYKGTKMTLAEFAERVGVPYKRLHRQMSYYGIDAVTAAERLLSRP